MNPARRFAHFMPPWLEPDYSVIWSEIYPIKPVSDSLRVNQTGQFGQEQLIKEFIETHLLTSPPGVIGSHAS